MQVYQSSSIQLKREKEYILIPYRKEKGVQKEWLQFLLPLDDGILDEWIQSKEKRVIRIENCWIQVEFLPILQESASLIEDLKIAFQSFGKKNTHDYQILLEHLDVDMVTKEELIQIVVQAILEGAYQFNKEVLKVLNQETLFEMRHLLTDEKEQLTLTIIAAGNFQKAIETGLIYGRAINYARTLANLPNNYLNIHSFTSYTKQLADFYQLEYEALGKEELEKLNCGGILSVNAGCKEEPRLIKVMYRGNESQALSAIIGKGVMFDAGGYHLKSLEGMNGMHYDMCGAANVLAVLEIITALKSKENVMLLIPVVENVISSEATKMGDVITTMSGKTVEVWNTDAEGRLILCDALTYAIKQGATRLIDLATLTYSCQNALGSEISGLFSNNEDFYQDFKEQAHKMGEKVWRLPLDPIYHNLLKHTITADLVNYAPGYGAGASIAACFLEEFIEKDIPWIHLDIVGTAVCREEKKNKVKGATGILTTTIASYLEHLVH